MMHPNSTRKELAHTANLWELFVTAYMRKSAMSRKTPQNK